MSDGDKADNHRMLDFSARRVNVASPVKRLLEKFTPTRDGPPPVPAAVVMLPSGVPEMTVFPVSNRLLPKLKLREFAGDSLD